MTGLDFGSISAVSRVRSSAGPFSLIVFPNTGGWHSSLVWTMRVITPLGVNITGPFISIAMRFNHLFLEENIFLKISLIPGQNSK